MSISYAVWMTKNWDIFWFQFTLAYLAGTMAIKPDSRPILIFLSVYVCTGEKHLYIFCCKNVIYFSLDTSLFNTMQQRKSRHLK